MKNIFFFVLVVVAGLPVRAQKIIEKHLDFKAGSSVRMDFQISDSIRIITWNKNEVFIKSSIDVNDNKDNDEYVMTFDGSDNEVKIRGKLEWKEGRGRRITVRKGKDSSDKGDDCCCCNCNSEIIHEVYIPDGADFSVETINGNIVITGKPGAVRAHTISGFIDLAVSPERAGSVEMKTISGTMYSNYNFPTDVHKPRRVGGGSISEELNGGRGKRIDLETISGDIFFRKAS
jgi:hypothetical protein